MPLIPCHFELHFRDTLDKQGNEVQDRDSSFNIGIILVFVVMESHIFTIIGIDLWSGDDGTAKGAADIFDDSIAVAEIGVGIDIENVLILLVRQL